jgi:molybdopterin molybdotransferase
MPILVPPANAATMPAMITYDEACAAIAAIAAAPGRERLPIAHAHGRVLAEAVALDRDQPPFDRATMDGYAIMPEPWRLSYPVVGTVAAGESWERPLVPGQALRIMTGAPCPPGVAVVPIELTDRGQAEVTVGDAGLTVPGRNVARRGEDGRAGAVVVAAGTRLDPLTVAAAAMAGARAVAVTVPPRLAILTTGDEVGGAGAAAAAINDSNGPLLEAFAAALGLAATRAHVRDDAGAVRAALETAADAADIVVTTGGVSVGDRDLIVPLAGELGWTTVFHHVAMQPGKPAFLARRARGDREGFLIGLPGNPVSVAATAHLLLWPLIARLGGCRPPRWRALPLATAWRHRGNRRLFLPALRGAAGAIAPVTWNGSGDLIAAAAADGLIDLAPGAELAAGALVPFLPWAGARDGERGILPDRVPPPRP